MRRYNQIIGFATRDIAPGEHVHVHNLGRCGATSQRDYAFGADVQADTSWSIRPRPSMGIVRADGRVATRNYIGILSTVNCSATVVARDRRAVRPNAAEALADYPNVDGVVALTHGTGCGMDMTARAWTCCAARSPATRATQLRRRAHHRARLRGQPDRRALASPKA